MSTGNRVEWIGGEAAMRDLRQWADQVAPAVDKAAAPFAAQVADVVRARVPRLTGQLAGSVEVSEAGDGVAVEEGAGLAYAGWIEFGGSRGRPYYPQGRYLYPSAEEAAADFQELAADTAGETARRFPWTH